MDRITNLLLELDYERFVIFLVVGFFGATTHYVKKWLKGEIKSNLFSYVFIDHPKHSILSIFTFTGVAFSTWMSGELDGLSVKALISLGYLTGYTVDSVTNKGTTHVNNQS